MSPSVESCWPQVYRFAMSLTRDAHLAEDLAQDTIARAVERQEQLRCSRSRSAWLFQIASNLWRDDLRRRKSRSHSIELSDVACRDASEHRIDLQDDVAAVLQVMQSLPETQRAVLHLYAVEEMTLPEIAEILDVKPDTVRVHLCHARRTVRQRLPQLWNEVKSPRQS